jgi:arsenate reductase-like glutaredoxin family protein
MRFGVIKTLVENKLVKSFVDNKLDKDMKFFKNELLENKSFKRLFFIYDTLKENKSLDKETAVYLVDDLSKEVKSIKLSENFVNKITKWTNGIIKENNYTIIDDLIYGDDLKPEKKSIAKKNIVESLTKEPIVKDSKKVVPISTMLKIANSNIEKTLSELNESDREEVISLLKKNPTKEEFETIKESTIQKLEKLISEADEEIKQTLLETKTKIKSSEFNKKEFIKIEQLNNGLIV